VFFRTPLQDATWSSEDDKANPVSAVTKEDLSVFATLLNCVEASDPDNYKFIHSLLQSMTAMYRDVKRETFNTDLADTMLLTLLFGVQGFLEDLRKLPAEIQARN
jgi:hypothetical protein